MSERPKVDKPRVQEWQNDDEELSKLLNHLESKVLNTANWEVYHPMKNKYIKFDEMQKGLLERKYPALWDLESIKGFVMYLPEKMNLINKELFTVIKRFSLNLQERLSFIGSVDEYIDQLESEIQELKENNSVGDVMPDIAELKEKVEMILLKFKNESHFEEPVIEKVPEKKEVEPEKVEDSRLK